MAERLSIAAMSSMSLVVKGVALIPRTGASLSNDPLVGRRSRRPRRTGAPTDGESPVHGFTVDELRLDPTSIIDAQFTTFVRSPDLTDAESCRSSAVFHSDLRPAASDIFG